MGAALAVVGCTGAEVPVEDAPPSASIQEVKDRHAETWMALPGVTGVGIGLCDEEPCIRVFLAAPSPRAEDAIPEEVEGHRVDLHVGGAFRAAPTGGPPARDSAGPGGP